MEMLSDDFVPLIRGAQILLLLAGIAAFAYGAFTSATDLYFLARGVKAEGIVVGEEEHPEDRRVFPTDGFNSDLTDRYTTISVVYPTVQYRWPPETGELYRHHSEISFEGPEMEAVRIGSRIEIRVIPGAPWNARLPGEQSHLLWSCLALVSGLAAVVLVSSLFYLPDAFFGRDVSKGISLFRCVNWPLAVGVALAVSLAAHELHRRFVPWFGPEEAAALATGDIFLLPPLLAAKGPPPAGKTLNDAERFMASIPGIGSAFADQAVERAIASGDDAMAGRYLAAAKSPETGFRIASDRALALAAARGKEEFVRALLDLGIPPDAARLRGMEPARGAARHNHVRVLEMLIAAGARADDPKRPLLIDALEGRAEEAARFLIEKGNVHALWREPVTNSTTADLALTAGMADISEMLEARGVPVTLPPFFKSVVLGDAKGLARAVPRGRWVSVRHGDLSLLHLAARYRQRALAEELIRTGIPPGLRDPSTGNTPLIEAVIAGDRQTALMLAALPESGLNRGDINQVSPIAHAVRKDRWELARALADAGADVNVRIGDTEGNSLLHIAAACGKSDAVSWLMAHGADPRAENFRRATPPDVARSAAIMTILKGSPPAS